MDLSVGYTPTSIGLELCGCSDDVVNCELLHVVMQNGTNALDCPEISITERWWREQRDLIDIYDPETCQEYPESASHSDRYEISTEHLEPGDTLRLLVCKTEPEDDFVMEFSATPGPSCSTFRCAPQMSCPVETSLHPDGQCRYIIPDFLPSIILRDTCMSPPTIVTGDFTIMQTPAPGTQVSEPLFVEIEVATDEGEVITACDISILLAPNLPPTIDIPQELADIQAHEPFPSMETIFATDTVGLGIIQQIPAFATVDSFERDDCDGYIVTYRWSATDGCGATSEITSTFSVLPDNIGPSFTSQPTRLDTVLAGEEFPIIEDLQAENPDGSTEGVSITSSVDAFVIDDCRGYEVTYRWIARDTCEDETMVTSVFFVEPNRTPPMFLNGPNEIPNIYASDSLPVPEELIAVNAEGMIDGVEVIHSFELLNGDPCDSLEVVYSWVATDTCGLMTDVSTSFFILPDTLTGFVSQGLEDLMVELSVECTETAQIVVPIDLDRFVNHVVTITIFDEDGEEVDEYLYTGPEDYLFGTGSFQVIYDIGDQCGNSIQDTINVQVADVSAPLFVCTDDHFVVLTDFNSCTAAADWPVPIVQDNCDDVGIIQISGPVLGEQIPVGTYEIIYEAKDESGNSSRCSFLLTVSSADLMSLSCEQVDLYVGTSCEAMFTLEDVFNIESVECLPDFELSVFTQSDTLTGDTIILTNLFNQVLSYQFCDIQTGICCKNDIVVLDTIAPVIACTDTISISCLEDPQSYRPNVFEECTEIIWRVRDLATEDICDVTDVSLNITREFIALDQAGNVSAACVVVIQVTPADLADLENEGSILWPVDITLSCEDFEMNQLSNRTLDTPNLESDIPTLTIEDACNITSFLSDRIISQTSCVTIIERTWTVRDDSCESNQQEVTNIQMITLIDDRPPTATILADTFRVLISQDECYGYFNTRNIAIQLEDDCQSSSALRWSLVLNGEFVPPIDSIPLPYGPNQVVIALFDECDNIGYDTLHVTVRDHIMPVAICLEHTVIAVSDEVVFYPAEALDVGSSDNCEVAEILVRKMDRTCPSEDSRFKNHVMICCADVGDTITLMLKVIDQAGNENYCTGSLRVQDKVAPTISCPPDIVVNCTIDLSTQDEADPFGHLFGKIGSFFERSNIQIHPRDFVSSSGEMLDGFTEDNCGTPNVVVVDTREELDDCGAGFIYRSFTAVDQYGNQSETCTQTIEIRSGGEELNSRMIRFPKEEITITSCGDTSNISPNFLGRPELSGASCALIAMSYEDMFLNSDEDIEGSCVKVIRTWTIVDWCDEDPLSNAIIYEQVIKLTDQKAPTITSCSTYLHFAEPSDNCDHVLVELSSYALDDCVASSSLRWTLEIDYNASGFVDERMNLRPDSTGHVLLKIELPIGEHLISWTVLDPCGNSSSCSELILVENSKAPVPFAIGTATSLGDNGAVELWAEDVIIKSEHPCTSNIQELISRSNEGIESAAASLIFTCDDIGTQDIKVYSIIELSDGSITYSFTIVSVAVREGEYSCGSEASNNAGLISGIVFLEDGRLVPDVKLSLFQSFSNEYVGSDTTGVAGLYDLGEISAEAPHAVMPSLGGSPTAGLSTLDMILVQRHLLGIEKFDSPYKIIASDINRDRRLSSLDLLHMRRALLRLDSDFDHHPSWRFINDQQYFRDQRFPMEEELPKDFFVTYDNPILDLVAIKIGDVNGSVELSNDHLSASRSVVSLVTTDKKISENEEVTVQLQLPTAKSLSGYQMTISFDADILTLLDVETYKQGEVYFNLLEPGLLLVSSTGEKDLYNNDYIAQIKFSSLAKGQLSELLSIQSAPLEAELYTTELESQELRLSFIDEININDKNWNLVSVSPNPFSSATTVTIDLMEDTELTMEIYDISGRRVVSQHQILPQGVNSIELSSKELPDKGVYGYRLSSATHAITGKLIYTN